MTLLLPARCATLFLDPSGLTISALIDRVQVFGGLGHRWMTGIEREVEVSRMLGS